MEKSSFSGGAWSRMEKNRFGGGGKNMLPGNLSTTRGQEIDLEVCGGETLFAKKKGEEKENCAQSNSEGKLGFGIPTGEKEPAVKRGKYVIIAENRRARKGLAMVENRQRVGWRSPSTIRGLGKDQQEKTDAA